MTKKDITNRADIYKLVSTFYGKIRQDKTLGDFFNNKIENWEIHFEHLTTFWESNLFLKTKYLGNPVKIHIEVDNANYNSIESEHFGLWLNLWYETIDELFQGDYAENAKYKARKMGSFLYLKIFEARKHKL